MNLPVIKEVKIISENKRHAFEEAINEALEDWHLYGNMCLAQESEHRFEYTQMMIKES